MAKNITLAIPNDLYKKMKLMKEIRWSEITRDAIKKKIEEELLRNEIELQDWSVKLQRKGRKGRFEELKRKGLI